MISFTNSQLSSKPLGVFVLVLGLSLAFTALPMPAQAASLTNTQTWSILNVLSAFGVDQSAVENMAAAAGVLSTPTGQLTVTGCTVPANQATCAVSTSWTTQNYLSYNSLPFTQVNIYNTATGQPATGTWTEGVDYHFTSNATGSYTFTLSPGTYTFKLYTSDGINWPTLDTKQVTISKPIGYFDNSTNTTLGGWSVDVANTSASNQVAIYMDGPQGTGTLVATIPANTVRSDVNAALGISGNHGFSWTIPTQYTTQSHTWYIYGDGLSESNITTLLIGGPRTTQAATATSPTPILTTITVTPSASLVVGKTQQLIATPLSQSGSSIAATLSWASSNTSVATVSSSGLVTAVAAGTANVTASSGSVKSNASVITVTSPIAAPKVPTGQLSVSSCTIASGQSTCAVPTNWTVQNPLSYNESPDSQVSILNASTNKPYTGTWTDGTSYQWISGASAGSSSYTFSLPAGVYTFDLYTTDGTNWPTLDTKQVTVTSPAPKTTTTPPTTTTVATSSSPTSAPKTTTTPTTPTTSVTPPKITNPSSPVPANIFFLGTLDHIGVAWIEGYACSQSNYEKPVSVEVYASGTTGDGTTIYYDGTTLYRVAVGTANQSDVARGAVCSGNTSADFHIVTPASLLDRANHMVVVYAKNTSTGALTMLSGATTFNSSVLYSQEPIYNIDDHIADNNFEYSPAAAADQAFYGFNHIRFETNDVSSTNFQAPLNCDLSWATGFSPPAPLSTSQRGSSTHVGGCPTAAVPGLALQAYGSQVGFILDSYDLWNVQPPLTITQDEGAYEGFIGIQQGWITPQAVFRTGHPGDAVQVSGVFRQPVVFPDGSGGDAASFWYWVVTFTTPQNFKIWLTVPVYISRQMSGEPWSVSTDGTTQEVDLKEFGDFSGNNAYITAPLQPSATWITPCISTSYFSRQAYQGPRTFCFSFSESQLETTLQALKTKENLSTLDMNPSDYALSFTLINAEGWGLGGPLQPADSDEALSVSNLTVTSLYDTNGPTTTP
jgi:hypothetical protein